MRPEQRVIVGRNVTLTAGTIYAASRAIYYATLNPGATSPAQGVITYDGSYLWAWSGVWAIAGLFCIVDMVNRHTRHGLSLVVGLAFAWGIAYGIMWAVNGFDDGSLISTSIGWLTPAGLVWGFLFKVTALQDMLRSQKENA